MFQDVQVPLGSPGGCDVSKTKKKKKKKDVDTLLQLLWGQMVDDGAVGGRESEKPTPRFD